MKIQKWKMVVFALLLSGAANAQSFNFGNLFGGLLGGSSSSGGLQDLVINAGLLYAKTDPRIGPVLLALNINNADDVKKFLNGDLNGSNFQDVLSHLAFQYAANNPEFQQWFGAIGVSDPSDLKNIINGKNGSQLQETILQMALAYAENNPKYQEWLDNLEIDDIEDLKMILDGDLESSNIMDVVMSFGNLYLKNNPQYSQYAGAISLIMNLLNGGGASNDDIVTILPINEDLPVFLGAYDGIPASEVKKIQTSTVKKATKTKKQKSRGLFGFLGR